MGRYGSVELKPKKGRHLGTGKTIDLHTYIVMMDGRQVGVKSKHFSSAIQWTSKIPEDAMNYVVAEVRELLGDQTRCGHTVGMWDHEITNEEDTNEGDQLDDIFN